MSTTTTRRGSGAQLNQIVAIEAGLKTRVETIKSQCYKDIQKQEPLRGIARTYAPREEGGEQLPGESTRVQLRATDIVEAFRAALTRLLDVTLTKDAANREAVADIVVDGQVLVTDVPVTSLLTLEKQVVEIQAFFHRLPVLDIAEKWDFDPAANAYATPVTGVARTKKLPRNHVLAPATDKHPAQVQMYNEDVVVGYWSTIKYSGALPAERKAALVERVEKLLDAVRFAREAANAIPVVDRHIGGALFEFLLA